MKNVKGKILKSAKLLFWMKGYEKTTMRGIALSCGFTSGNLYNYFKDKETILYEILEGEMTSLVKMVSNVEGDKKLNAVQKLKLFIRAHIEHTLIPTKGQILHYETEWRHLTPKHQKNIIKLRDIYDEVIRNIIDEGIMHGYFDKSVNAKFVNYVISSIIVRARIWYLPKGEWSYGKLAELIYNIITEGILSEKGSAQNMVGKGIEAEISANKPNGLSVKKEV